MATREQARHAKQRARELLGEQPGFSGVGLVERDGDFHLRVNVASEDQLDQIPTSVDGVEVDIEVVGTIGPHRHV